MLTPQQTRRHLRHLLLAEIGEAGQARLCAAAVTTPADASARAAAVARDYLERSGVDCGAVSGSASAIKLEVARDSEVDRLAGAPQFREAAAALAGAFAATEAIKRIVGVGRAARLPTHIALDRDPA